jgi:hypothetical protein
MDCEVCAKRVNRFKFQTETLPHMPWTSTIIEPRLLDARSGRARAIAGETQADEAEELARLLPPKNSATLFCKNRKTVLQPSHRRIELGRHAPTKGVENSFDTTCARSGSGEAEIPYLNRP